jgi:transcriptional regulator with XRE-family HTH domain
MPRPIQLHADALVHLPFEPPAPASCATRDVAQQILLRYSVGMPVALAQKVEALRVDFRSAARLADLLGVSRSQVTRWLRGAGIDPVNAEKVDLLELVWSSVLRLYDRDAALAWLFGLNPQLGDRRPIDLIRLGRAEELMRAIRAERSDTFV